MTKAFMLLPLLLSFCMHAVAQDLIPFEFTSEEENRLIRENDSLKYYVASDDTLNTVCLNEEEFFYSLLNRSQKTIAEGHYITEGDRYLQTGKWVERYDNGKLKTTGNYHRNKPIGTWQEFYPTGKLKTVSNYSIITNEKGGTNYCLSGTWQEYFPDGKIKVNGLYIAGEIKGTDTIIVDDPITDQKITKVATRDEYKPIKTGTWEYYSENGELDRKEEF